MRLTLRTVLSLALLLVGLEVGISACYLYWRTNKTELQQSKTVLGEAVHLRATLLRAAKVAKPDTFKRLCHLMQDSLLHSKTLSLFMDKSIPQDTWLLPQSRAVDKAVAGKMLHRLTARGYLSISTDFPKHLGDRAWVSLSMRTPVYAPRWQHAFVYFLGNFLFLILLWLGFFIYYRHTLPKELLGKLRDERSGQKSDSTVAQLSQKIKAYVDEKNLMLTALSHDLKTPLTEAMLKLDLLRERKEAESIKQSLLHINDIINSSLDYSKAPDKVQKSPVDIVLFVRNITESYRDTLKITFASELEHYDLPVEVVLFERMVRNILNNAKEYSRACFIELSAPKGGSLTLKFKDDGEGVPEHLLAKLGVPYFRVDPSRSRTTGGTGLGLAIIKHIAALHNGEVRFYNSKHGGFVVELVFKKD
jgi:signal transduction histidine kinase